MPQLLNDDELRQAALTLLETELGPVETLRFLALVRREPFDYQTWRDRSFGSLGVGDVFKRLQRMETDKP